MAFAGCAESQWEETLSGLEKLGIEVDEQAREEILRSIEKTLEIMPEDIREKWGFELDYYSVLVYLGMGAYNEAEFSYVPYTDSVFAFDLEAYDLTYGYMSLLDALARMSGGELKVDGVDVKISDEQYMTGQGTFEIDFAINDQPYTYEARMDFDWLDVELINYLNEILEDSGARGRLLGFFDGQMLVLFYNTPAWAKEFEQVTGIALQTGVQ